MSLIGGSPVGSPLDGSFRAPDPFEVSGNRNKILIPTVDRTYAKREICTNIKNFAHILPRINELTQYHLQDLDTYHLSGDLPERDIRVDYDKTKAKIIIRSDMNAELFVEIDVPENDQSSFKTDEDDKEQLRDSDSIEAHHVSSDDDTNDDHNRSGFKDDVRHRGTTVDLPTQYTADKRAEEKSKILNKATEQKIFSTAGNIFTLVGAMNFWAYQEATMESRFSFEKGIDSGLTRIFLEAVFALASRIHYLFAGSITLIATIVKIVPRIFIAGHIVHEARMKGEYGEGFKAVLIASANYFKLAIAENFGGLVRDVAKTALIILLGTSRGVTSQYARDERTSLIQHILKGIKAITPDEFEFWEARHILKITGKEDYASNWFGVESVEKTP